MNWKFWVNANLELVLQYDNLNQFVPDTGYWPKQMDFLRTSSTFLFNLDGANLDASNLVPKPVRLDSEYAGHGEQKESEYRQPKPFRHSGHSPSVPWKTK